MERRLPPPPNIPSSKNPLLRSSVSMFIEDSRITAVANAEPPPSIQDSHSFPRRPSFFSVTSYSSSSSTSFSGGGGGGGLRPTFSTPSTPPSRPRTPQRACSSSPVRFAGRDIFQNVIREDEELSSVTPGGRRPLPPASTVRRRSTLSVEPNFLEGFLQVKESLPQIREDRAYTSVNLTLRAPSACSASGVVDRGETCGSTVISSSAGLNMVNTVNVNMTCPEGGGAMFRHTHRHSLPTGVDRVGIEEEGGDGDDGASSSTNLMYSTYSNSRDGFEAQVQIQFGPGGGTFTACRRRTTNVGLQGGVGGERRSSTFQSHNISIRQQMSTGMLNCVNKRNSNMYIYKNVCILKYLLDIYLYLWFWQRRNDIKVDIYYKRVMHVFVVHSLSLFILNLNSKGTKKYNSF